MVHRQGHGLKSNMLGLCRALNPWGPGGLFYPSITHLGLFLIPWSFTIYFLLLLLLLLSDNGKILQCQIEPTKYWNSSYLLPSCGFGNIDVLFKPHLLCASEVC